MSGAKPGGSKQTPLFPTPTLMNRHIPAILALLPLLPVHAAETHFYFVAGPDSPGFGEAMRVLYGLIAA